MMAIKIFTSVKKYYKLAVGVGIILLLSGSLVKQQYTNADFGASFDKKAQRAASQLTAMEKEFELCATLCNTSARSLRSIVFPEVMRYNELKDDIEAESLRTLYVQFGNAYADFSIGLFQMKPSFAQQVERLAKQLLPAHLYTELQLEYTTTDAENIRQVRLERLRDKDWQLVYLTAFVAVCNKLYSYHSFAGEFEKMQWYAAVYNCGIGRPDSLIKNKISDENRYLSNGMPEKKFKYAAIAGWYYRMTGN